MFDDDVVAHGMQQSGAANKDDLRQHYQAVFFELKDGVLLSDDIVVAGNMAAQRYHSLLYLYGRFDGVYADNQPVFLRGQTFFRFGPNGKISERWSNHDHAVRMRQLLGAEGEAKGRKIASILNGPSLPENKVRSLAQKLNDAFNTVTDPTERRRQTAMMLDPDVVVHGLANTSVGIEELNQYYDRIWRAFPDIERQYDALLSAWSFAGVRWRALGSHRGTYQDTPPTRRPTWLRGEMIIRFNRDGLIAELWINDAPIEQL